MGAKGKPFYRLVVKEKRSKRDGAYLENLGTYDPMADPAEVNLKHERIQYWIGVGAQPTDTVASLIKNNPVQTEDEKAAALAAREAKKEAERKVREETKRAESERLEAERVAAEKAAADAAAAEAAAAEASAAESAEAAPTDSAEPASDAAAEEAPAEEAPKTEE